MILFYIIIVNYYIKQDDISLGRSSKYKVCISIRSISISASGVVIIIILLF
jgi:hypothetical protein